MSEIRKKNGPSRALAALLLALALCACASRRAHLGPIPGELESAPPLSANPVSDEPYRIRAGDELEIRFFHTPDQNVILPVRPDGFIALPLVHELRAAGRTVEDLRAELVQRCSQQLVDPEIAVIVRTFHTSYAVHVGGAVDKPGVLELDGPRSVLEAVFAAGGFTPEASPSDVIVVRKREPVGYELVAANLAKVLKGEDARGNLTLRPYDVVYVPSTRIADVNKWVDQYLRKNIPISFSYRLDSPNNP